jgi:hypothetical protein
MKKDAFLVELQNKTNGCNTLKFLLFVVNRGSPHFSIHPQNPNANHTSSVDSRLSFSSITLDHHFCGKATQNPL